MLIIIRLFYTLAKEKAGDTLPVIATGHLTTVGGELTESVREIYIGSLTAFPASAFPDADYIALGHLHRPQIVAKQEHIRYSGSPIPLSFDEASTTKQIVLVDFEENKVSSIHPVEVPLFRPLITLKGSLTEIEEQLDELKEQNLQSLLPPWLEIEILTDDYLSDLQSRVELLLQEKEELPSCEVLRVRRNHEKQAALLSTDHRKTLVELTIDDVFNQRLQLADLSEERAVQLTCAFQEIVEAVEEHRNLVVE